MEKEKIDIAPEWKKRIVYKYNKTNRQTNGPRLFRTSMNDDKQQ